MMKRRRYSVATRITGPLTNAPFAVLLPSEKLVCLVEVGIVLVAATATSFGLVRAATPGTANVEVVGQKHSIHDAAAKATLKTGWSSAPTLSSPVYLRRIALPATAVASVTWTFDETNPVVGNAENPIALWNFGAGTASDVDLHLTWDEVDG